MPIKAITSIYALFALLNLAVGAVLLTVSLIWSRLIYSSPSTAARDVLLRNSPLNFATFVGPCLIFTSIMATPAIFLPRRPGWLRAQAALITLVGVLMLILGLRIWTSTLQSRTLLNSVWDGQSDTVKSQLQAEFQCCGYNASYVTDTTCPNALTASLMGACIDPFTDFAGSFQVTLFTSIFAFVGLIFAWLLCLAVLWRARMEQRRYRLIDEKNRIGP